MDFIPVQLNKTKLPTNCDIMQHLLFLRQQCNNQSYGLSKFYKATITELCELWKFVQIPVKSYPAIWKKVQYLTWRYRDVKKNPRHYNINDWNVLFNISLCECSLIIRNPCRCTGKSKIPRFAWKFYVDQAGPRMKDMLTCGFVRGRHHNPNHSPVCSEAESESSYVLNSINVDESDQVSSSSENEKNIKVDKPKLPTFSAALDRAGVSNRYGALLANTLLKDLNITGIIIDQHKIRRERNKARNSAKKNLRSNSLLKGISFDGKRERTLKQVVVNGSPRNVKVMEEHVTLVKEPNSCFIGYITPEDGKGREIAKGILSFLSNEGIALDNLVAVNCDGTSTNTGKHNGTICTLERELHRPLQWFVCLFHFNELPFVALLKSLLGKATGPQNWPGNIGNLLRDCENIPPISNFAPISMGEMPENIDSWDLRADQKYLFQMVKAVDSGNCDSHVASLKPGLLNLSRWLTTASRTLRLYVTQTAPSEELTNLALFVMKVYAPFWFLVKSQPHAIHGSRHLLKYIKWTRMLPIELQQIVNHSIQINGFFAHPENILLSMATDKEKELRSEALKIIIEARDSNINDIRQFNIPKILFECESLKDMINWNEIGRITEPPCIQFYSHQYLKDVCDSEEIIEIPEFPCHSQNTERFVKLVSQSCLSVIESNRPGHIANKMESCKLYTKIESRKDFLCE